MRLAHLASLVSLQLNAKNSMLAMLFLHHYTGSMGHADAGSAARRAAVMEALTLNPHWVSATENHLAGAVSPQLCGFMGNVACD